MGEGDLRELVSGREWPRKREREGERKRLRERAQPQVGTFDSHTCLAQCVGLFDGRHIHLSGKTGLEGQVFEHLLREVFKRLNTSSRRVFTQYA